MKHFNTPLEALRYHVSGAIARGEGTAIVCVPAKPATYNQWLAAVSDEVRNALGCDSSDAFGVVEAQPFALAQCWARGNDAIDTCAAILKQS